MSLGSNSPHIFKDSSLGEKLRLKNLSQSEGNCFIVLLELERLQYPCKRGDGAETEKGKITRFL